MPNELKLRVILRSPPSGVDFALQSGHGNKYLVVGRQRSGTGDLKFELAIEVKTVSNPAGSATLDFSGPFVQGKKGERFFYIDIGTYAGQTESQWGRRLKIPLHPMPSRTVEQAMKTDGMLETSIAGTGKDGGPSCATPKDFLGWDLC